MVDLNNIDFGKVYEYSLTDLKKIVKRAEELKKEMGIKQYICRGFVINLTE